LAVVAVCAVSLLAGCGQQTADQSDQSSANANSNTEQPATADNAQINVSGDQTASDTNASTNFNTTATPEDNIDDAASIDNTLNETDKTLNGMNDKELNGDDMSNKNIGL